MCKIFTGGYLADYAPLDRLGEIYGNSGLIKISLDCRHITGLCGGLICYIIFNVDEFVLHFIFPSPPVWFSLNKRDGSSKIGLQSHQTKNITLAGLQVNKS